MPKRQPPKHIVNNLDSGRRARTVTDRKIKINKNYHLVVNADRYRLSIEAFKNDQTMGKHVWGLPEEPTEEEKEEDGPSRVVIFGTYTAANGYQTHHTIKRCRSRSEAERWLRDQVKVVLETDVRITG